MRLVVTQTRAELKQVRFHCRQMIALQLPRQKAGLTAALHPLFWEQE